MKLILTVLCALSMSACATMQGLQSDITIAAAPTTPELEGLAGINAKLDNAIAISTAGNDPQGLACAQAGKQFVNTLPFPADTPPAPPVVLPAAIGVSGAIATARVEVRAVDAKVKAEKARLLVIQGAIANGFPDYVTGPCAVVVEDAKLLAAKIAAFLAIEIK
jgi:predicted small secreted protein